MNARDSFVKQQSGSEKRCEYGRLNPIYIYFLHRQYHVALSYFSPIRYLSAVSDQRGCIHRVRHSLWLFVLLARGGTFVRRFVRSRPRRQLRPTVVVYGARS
ncbi:hypothetical protein D917_05148 [Trichinella nativa]|uniref:Uncharacterized protein n=1 Tax=Trichinella nativa TaxID=6335 RepID=A0A1Y3EY29_9BILA|nr:hypothetical protein D917_05148 [Trichinella nativa]